MTLVEFKEKYPKAKRIAYKQLVAIIRGGVEDIEEYIIDKSPHLVITETIIVRQRLSIRNCFFDDIEFFLYDIICEGEVVFNNCYFHKHFFLSECSFKGLEFYETKFEYLSIQSGSFGRIIMYKCGGDTLSITGGKINHLMLVHQGEYINSVVINNTPRELGNLTLLTASVGELSISGDNVGNTYRFDALAIKREIRFLSFTNNGVLSFKGLKAIDTLNTPRIKISESNLIKAEFYNVDLGDGGELALGNSYIAECLFIGFNWNIKYKALSDRLVDLKELYRQLRLSMNKHNDKINEMSFYAKEMNVHNQCLKWNINTVWDKLILYLSRYTSNYGQSFGKPLMWLLIFHFIFFIIAVYGEGFKDIVLTLSPNWAGFRIAFEKYFTYINPFRSSDTSLKGFLIFVDLLMRISASYMIYNVIRASRRFIA